MRLELIYTLCRKRYRRLVKTQKALLVYQQNRNVQTAKSLLLVIKALNKNTDILIRSIDSTEDFHDLQSQRWLQRVAKNNNILKQFERELKLYVGTG